MAESPIGSSLSSKEVVFLWCSLMGWDWIAGSSEMKPLGYSDTKLACLVGAVGRIMFISFRCLASFLLARYLRIHRMTKIVKMITVITSKIVSKDIHDMLFELMFNRPKFVVFSSFPICLFLIGAFLLHIVS